MFDDEIELGMGIHGEMGAQRLKFVSLKQAIEAAFGQLFRGTRSIDIKRDDNVLLLVNNLGMQKIIECIFIFIKLFHM